MVLSSLDNPRLKRIKALNSQVKMRKRYQQAVVENKHYMLDLLASSPALFEYIVLALEHKDIEQKAVEQQIPVYACKQEHVQQLAHVKHAEGCFAVLKQPIHDIHQDFKLVLALDSINNPANMGAILRNAHAFGVEHVYLLGNCCDLFHPECIRASAGFVFHVSATIAEVTALEGYTCWKLDASSSMSLASLSFTGPTCFVLGSEQGFTEASTCLVKTCYIPMHHQADSLNVAAVSAVVLYAFNEKSV